jgi:hypothetical protein
MTDVGSRFMGHGRATEEPQIHFALTVNTKAPICRPSLLMPNIFFQDDEETIHFEAGLGWALSEAII